MSTEHLSARAKRTRTHLHQTLLALVVERDYRDITVQDILERAHIGRTTFYAYFRDKDDLLMSGMEPLRESLMKCVHAIRKGDEGEPLSFVKEFFAQGQAYLEPYRSLSVSVRAIAQERLTAMLVEAARQEFKRRSGFRRLDAAVDPVAHGVAGAAMGLVEWWIRQETPAAVDDLYAVFQQIVAPGFHDAVRHARQVGAGARVRARPR